MYDHVVYKYLNEVSELVMNYYQGSLLRYLGIEEVKLSAKRRAEAFIANDFFNAYCMKDYVQNVCFNPEDSENPVLQFASFLYQCVGTLYEEITSMVSSRWASMKFKTINDLNYILWFLKGQFSFSKRKVDEEKVDDNPKDWDYIPKQAMEFILEHPEYYFKGNTFRADCSKRSVKDYYYFLDIITRYFDKHADIYMSGDAYNAFVAYIDNAIDTCVHEKTLIAKDVEEHWITYWGEEKTETDLRLQFLRMDRGKLYRIVADTCQITRLESNYSVSTEPKIGYFADDYFARDAFLNDCSSVKARRFDCIYFYE